jgi:uncharacterized delta-60 repeat protein
MRESVVRHAPRGSGRRTPRAPRPLPHAQALEPRRLLSAGDLDPTFGAGGRVVLDNNAGAYDVVVQPDDKVLVCGPGSAGGITGFLVHRLNPDGSPDTTFGQGGRVLTDLGAAQETATAIALQPDGRILVAGNTYNSGPAAYTIALARYLPNGTLDPTFGTGGRATLTPHARPHVNDIALLPDGKILLAGGVEPQQFVADPLLMRLTTIGAPDTTFSGDGVIIEPSSVDDELVAVTADAAGRPITSMSQRGGNLTVSRYTAAGAPDTTFGTSGRTRISGGSGGGVALDAAGNVVVAYNDFSRGVSQVGRLTPVGAFDRTFGSSGFARASEGGLGVADLAIQYDGSIVVAGTAPPARMAAARLLPGGALDLSFGNRGTAIVPRNDPGDEWGAAVALAPDGRILIAGKVGDIEVGDISVVRLDPGPVTVPFRLSPDGYLAVSGTAGDDAVSITRSLPTPAEPDGVHTVTINGLTRTFRGNVLRGITVETVGGRDTLTLGPRFDVDVWFDGGPGDDAATFNGSDVGDSIRLDRQAVFMSSSELTVENVELLTVRGNGGADNINAARFGGPNNNITGPAGLVLDGGDGNDVIEARFGWDTLLGGAGNDTLRARNFATNDHLDGGAGTDAAGYNAGDTVTSVETILNAVVSGTVFSDVDSDGTMDGFENIANLFTVYIDADNDGVLDAAERRVTTNGGGSSGNYTFDYLPAGTYVVRVSPPTTEAWQATTPTSFSVALTATQEATGRNFGFRQTSPAGSISGTVFDDRDGDGARDAGEPGIAGRTLYWDQDNDGVKDTGERSVATDAAGAYRFSNLQVATYRIRQVLPAGWRQTAPATPFAYFYLHAPGLAFDAADFGATNRSAIAGRVFHDLRSDGAFNTGDFGLAGVTVYVDANNNGRIDATELSTVTGESGDYVLAPLDAGTYVVRQVLLTDRPHIQTAPTGGGVYSITVGAAETMTRIDFGQAIPLTVSGKVFNDPDGNGRFEVPGIEYGLGGWTVYRDLDNDGAFDAGEPSDETDADGNYSLPDLSPGTIVLRAAPRAGWEDRPAYQVDLPSGAGSWTADFGRRRVAGVVGRHVFYNQSAFDGFDGFPGAADDAAVATDKEALRPGQTATFRNVSSYSRGLNGIMIDLPALFGSPGIVHFRFQVGTGGDPTTWPDAPTPGMDPRHRVPSDGYDRVTIRWPDGAVRNQWLRVTVKANEWTRLATPDVFYFGNFVGESGNAAGGSLAVTSADVLRTRAASLRAQPAGVTSAFDFNRDGRVDVRDVLIARTAARRLSVLQLISPAV